MIDYGAPARSLDLHPVRFGAPRQGDAPSTLGTNVTDEMCGAYFCLDERSVQEMRARCDWVARWAARLRRIVFARCSAVKVAVFSSRLARAATFVASSLTLLISVIRSTSCVASMLTTVSGRKVEAKCRCVHGE